MSRIILSLVVCMFALPVMAVETVREVGEVFICYYQNKGDNKFADSKSERYTASDKDWTVAEMEAFESALKAWDEVIDNVPPRKLKVGVYWLDMRQGRNVGPLALTRSAVKSDMKATGMVQAATVAESLWRDGVDRCPDKSFDICVYFNTGCEYSFAEKPDSSIPMYYDFRSVAVHELGHAFGFVSLSRSNGQFGLLPHAMHYTALDGLMVNAQGERLIDKAYGAKDGVGFKPGEVLSLKGGELKVYNPSRWMKGGSMVHVEMLECVMSAFMFPNHLKRDLKADELKLMQLMGWKVKINVTE